jgi:dihydrofolate reductase
MVCERTSTPREGYVMTDQRPFTGHVFIGTSLDGFIARTNGDLEWLTSRGEAAGEYGFQEFLDRIDTVAMGSVTYGNWLDLGPEQWPFHGKHVAVLSDQLDADDDPRITVYRNLDQLLKSLTDRGTKSVYVDGGRVIRQFLQAGLIDTITITTVPVLIGSGIPFPGDLEADIALIHQSTKVFGAGLVQSAYAVDR